MPMAASLGIVVPAFRPDVDVLGPYVRALAAELDPDALRVELDDPEPGVVDALADLPATVNAVPTRRGKGAAVTAGFEALSTEVLAFADADGSTPADSVAAVVAPVRAGDADLAAGSRRHPDATVHGHQTLARRRLGDAFAWLAGRVLSPDLYDYQCGAKALSADAWSALRGHLHEPGFAWDVELVAMAGALDLRVAEVPVEWEDQPGSTVSPVRSSLSMGRALVVARLRAGRVTDSRLRDALGGETTPLVERE